MIIVETDLLAIPGGDNVVSKILNPNSLRIDNLEAQVVVSTKEGYLNLYNVEKSGEIRKKSSYLIDTFGIVSACQVMLVEPV